MLWNLRIKWIVLSGSLQWVIGTLVNSRDIALGHLNNRMDQRQWTLGLCNKLNSHSNLCGSSIHLSDLLVVKKGT